MASTFVKEIQEHPEALNRLIAFYRGEGRGLLSEWRKRAEKARRIVFAGMGTSEFVAQSILPRLAEQGMDVSTLDAGELLHYPRPMPGLLVLISQSGESFETRKVAERLGHSNWVSITNNPQSTIARAAGLNLSMLAGYESAIANKTYANTLALLFLMTQSTETLDSALEQLSRVAADMTQVSRERIEAAAKLLADAQAIHFISRGPAMAAVKQSSLTFMEGTRTTATPFTGGAFRHGPYELVDALHRCVFFMPGGKTFELLKNMVTEVAGKGSHVVIITDQDFTPPAGQVCVLKVASHGEELFNIVAAPTQEFLLEAVARQRGVEAGVFRNSQKITAVE